MKPEVQKNLSFTADHRLDCSGHLCPVPILMTEEKMADLKKGEVLEVIFTDPGAKPDLEAWCKMAGHEILVMQWKGNRNKGAVRIRKKS